MAGGVARAAAVAGALLLGSLLPAAAQEGWATGEVPTGENFRSLWLAYTENGVQRFAANCPSNETVVHFQLPFVLADTGEGASIALQLQAGGASAQLSGFVSTYQGNAGFANGALATASPIVTAMASAPQLSFGVPGQQSAAVPLSSGRQQVSTFIGTCAFLQSGGSQQAAAPAPQPQTSTLDVQDAPQTAVAGPTDAPIVGLWQQTSSSYMPCPNCRAMVFMVGGTREAGHIGGFYTDSCLYGELRLDGELTRNVNGEGAARIRMAPTANAVATGNASLQVVGPQLTITITPTGAAGDGLVGTIVESYRKVAGPEALTSDLFNSFQAADGGAACVRYPQGAELAIFGQGGGAPSPGQVAGTTQPEGFTAGDAALIGGIAAGIAIVGSEIVDQFFTEAPAPEAPDGTGGRMTVTITAVRAVETTFGFGGDEIFLLFSDGTRFPADAGQAQSIDEGQTWSPNARVQTSGGLSVDLREWDSFNASDIIGNLVVEPNRPAGRYSATLRGDGAEYVIDYEVAREGRQAQGERGGQRPVPRPDSGSGRDRVWTSHNAGAEVTVTDCRNDCEEDIGIILMCQGYGQPALVSVPWAAVERGQPGAVSDLSVIVDRQAFAYRARLGEYGLVGHVPSFAIMPGDPLIEALQAGARAEIVFGGGSTSLSLRGSRRALDTFKAECGWNSVAAAPPPAMDPGPQPDVAPFWFVTQYDDFATGRPTTRLIHGLPETDAVGFAASCEGGGSNGAIAVDLIADFGTQPPGAVVPVYIQTQSYTSQYRGQVFIDSSEWAGIRTSIPRNDPIWQALQAANGQVIMGMGGGQPSFAGSAGAAQAVAQFMAACAAPQPGPQPAPQPTAGGTFHFQCDDGMPLTVTTTPVGEVFLATLDRNGTAYSLIESPGTVGRKYSNGVATLTISGAAAQFTAPNVVLFCQAN